MRRATGQYEPTVVDGEAVQSFLPDPLPPNPPLTLDGRLRTSLDSALVSLGRLDGVSSLLPDRHLLLYTYVRKEAVLSSQIEGTQSTLSDLLLFELEEAPGVPTSDVVEVSNHVAALEHGLSRLREGFPLSNRLIREIHGILLSRGRGADKAPGEFRRVQNWVGGTRPSRARHIPPTPNRVEGAMAALERFLHDDPEPTPLLLKAALAHVQFETIHPFLDGNGRVGRLLITLLLCAEGVLREPLLYLSLHFKAQRGRYYELLDGVRRHGEWEEWLGFFAEGIAETAQEAVATAHRLREVAQVDRDRIVRLGRGAGSAALVHHTLQSVPICTIARMAEKAKLTLPTVAKALEVLVEAGIVKEVTGKKRNRIYRYDGYMKILNEGMEPL